METSCRPLTSCPNLTIIKRSPCGATPRISPKENGCFCCFVCPRARLPQTHTHTHISVTSGVVYTNIWITLFGPGASFPMSQLCDMIRRSFKLFSVLKHTVLCDVRPCSFVFIVWRSGGGWNVFSPFYARKVKPPSGQNSRPIFYSEAGDSSFS